MQPRIEPLATVDTSGTPKQAARTSRYDDYGDLTHEGVISNINDVSFPVLGGANTTDLPDADTVHEITITCTSKRCSIVPTVSDDAEHSPVFFWTCPSVADTFKLIMAWRTVRVAVLPLLVVALICGAVEAASVAAPTPEDAGEAIILNFPDNVDLKVLIEYVSDRLGMNILYDEQQVNQKVTIKAPSKVSRSSLQGLLESALKMKGLVLADADQPGWKRIVAATNLANAAGPATMPSAGPTTRPAPVVTEVFVLRHADTQRVDQAIKAFLTQPGGNSISVPDQKTLIVTDFSSTVQRVSDLIRLIDQPQHPASVEFIPVRFANLSQLAQELGQLMSAKAKAQGGAAAAGAASNETVEIAEEPRTNQLVLIGSAERIEEARQLISRVDVPLQLTTQVYHFAATSPERIDKLVRELIGPAEAKRVYQSVIDKDGNILVVTATDEIQKRVQSLKSDLDVAIKAEQSPIRFYKLENTTAADVLETIQSLEGEGGGEAGGGVGRAPRSNTNGAGFNTPALQSTPGGMLGGTPPIMPAGVTGPNAPPAAAGQAAPTPPAFHGQGATGQQQAGGGQGQARATIKSKNATVTADPNTNSIIVIGDPATQQIYEQLIRTLDKRRPQVLVECTIVTLDTSHDLSVGVELSSANIGSNGSYVTFTSFGLSTPNPNTGQLALIPGLGFNGALVKADIGEIIIRALAQSGRAEVVAAPKILVNDNASGTLTSVAEQPFTSVNASTTVATTSFAGYASAGTTIALTPHISEGDHLQLEYVVTLNSFTGSGTSGVPPPRQTDSVQSEITIPDGDTIIVGGLNRKNYNESVSKIPVLGDIPVLGYLFSNRTNSSNNSTLFVFIRPIILRDDQFRDLKFLSARNVRMAGVTPNLPQSEPLLIQ